MTTASCVLLARLYEEESGGVQNPHRLATVATGEGAWA